MSLEKRPRLSLSSSPSTSNERPVIPEGIALDEETAREKGGKKDDGGEGRPLEPGPRLVGRVRFYGSSLLRNDSGRKERGKGERDGLKFARSQRPRGTGFIQRRDGRLSFFNIDSDQSEAAITQPELKQDCHQARRPTRQETCLPLFPKKRISSFLSPSPRPE